MCIIALKPEKVQFTKQQLKIMWDNNPHGAGFMYAEEGVVKVVKGLNSVDELWDAIQAAGPLRKMVLHFRIRTHGALSAEMTHPFWIKEGKLAMVHNGVIRPLTHLTTTEESDTAVFARKLAENYSNPLVAVKNPFHRDMLEIYIGYSKMVFMDGKGQTYILNEHLGEWHKNVWYSNQKYKPLTQQDRTQYIASHKPVPSTASFPGHFTPTEKKIPVPPVVEAAPKKSRSRKKAEKPEEKPVQKPLLGLPSTSHWDRIPFDTN
jgi:predicted glutamine amidotransferase